MTAGVSLPENFLIGAATAAHQVEGDNIHNDWWPFEIDDRLPERSGKACDHWNRFEADFDLARSWGHSAHRLSLEWSRIETREGEWSEAALDHYRAVLEALRQRSIEPVVTLHHFTNPEWFARLGGWTNRQAPELFARYCGKVVEALGSHVTFWLTVNEPTVYAKNAFVGGHWPPMRRSRWDLALRVVFNMMRAHRAAYRAIHRRSHQARVGFAHSAPCVHPCRPRSPMDQTCAVSRDFVLNDLPLRLLGRRPASFLDYLGLNYYTRSVVRWEPEGTAFIFGRDCLDDHHGGRRVYSNLGWEVYPEGLVSVLRKFQRLGVPLMITENGIATADDELRQRFLHDHLLFLGEALNEGIEVIGYLHWTLMDNFEWSAGWEPTFGLAQTDPCSLERKPRQTADFFATVCRNMQLPSSPSENYRHSR